MLEAILEFFGRIFVEIFFEFFLCGIFKFFVKIFRFTGLMLLEILPGSSKKEDEKRAEDKEDATPAWIGFLFYLGLIVAYFMSKN